MCYARHYLGINHVALNFGSFVRSIAFHVSPGRPITMNITFEIEKKHHLMKITLIYNLHWITIF